MYYQINSICKIVTLYDLNSIDLLKGIHGTICGICLFCRLVQMANQSQNAINQLEYVLKLKLSPHINIKNW
jgi:hypothetical protein